MKQKLSSIFFAAVSLVISGGAMAQEIVPALDSTSAQGSASAQHSASVLTSVSQASSETNVTQTSSESEKFTYRTIYAELFGASNLIGINFDSRFRKGSKFGYRVGLAYSVAWESGIFVYYSDSHTISIPVEVNGIFGKGHNYFEAGIGASPVLTFDSFTQNYDILLPDGSINEIKRHLTDTRMDCQIHINLGYRYQKPHGFQFRAGITPAVGFGSWLYLLLHPYVSFGYTFK